MADDVATANRALLIEINDCLERAFAQQGKGSGRIVELIDALIAAVRAEKDDALIERLTMIANEWQKRARAAEAILTANGIGTS